MNSSAETRRAATLEEHLERENPLLLEPLAEFRKLDRVARGLGLLAPDDSFTRRVPWWPVISLLGTFSAGKSTFINGYLGLELQRTGNQAVDDRFTVICYGEEEEPRTLPGSALDADPRFPFYRISGDIDEVAAGEGRRINTYLQLRACNSEAVRGKILLDSPGFDADSQRTATLRITDRIIDLSDLVLVFFDARHPEPGSMRDTLQHLVAGTIARDDASKFVFVLNQIDAAAAEDNPEDLVGAWQRALASAGLTAGHFLRIYDEQAAAPILDETLAARFKAKKDEDMAEIHRRIRAVEVDRTYRVVELLHSAAETLRGVGGVQDLREYRQQWRSRTLLYDGLALVPVVLALLAGLFWANEATRSMLSTLFSGTVMGWILVVGLAAAALAAHLSLREFAAKGIAKKIPPAWEQPFRLDMRRAFNKGKPWWRSMLLANPPGWNPLARRRVNKVVANRETMVQRLNDRFTMPSG